MNKITTWRTEHPEVIFTFEDGTQDRYNVDDLAELRMQTYNLAESQRWDDLPEEPTTEHLTLSLQLLEQQHKKYVKGFNLLMDYWDSLPEEEKPHIDKQLKELGL